MSTIDSDMSTITTTGSDEIVPSVPITLTLDELWHLHALIRHEVPSQREWHYPPANAELNADIGAAILACTDDGLEEYTLLLNPQQLCAIDYHVRADQKPPAWPAYGEKILLKAFRARARPWLGPLADTQFDRKYVAERHGETE